MTALYTDRMGMDWDGDDPDDVVVAGALDMALKNVTSYLAVALHYDDLDPDVIDALDDRCFDELKDLLSKEQLAKAVVALLVQHASPLATRMVTEIRDLPELPAATAKNGTKLRRRRQPRRDTT